MANEVRVVVKAVDKATQTTNRITGRMKSMAGVVSIAAVTAGAAIGKMINKAADFDAALNQSIAIMGDVSDVMRNDMSDAARVVAQQTTFSAKQAAESYFFLASAGLDAKASIEALPRVSKFAQAGMFDMSLATDLLTDAQSALGLAVKNDAIANLENMTRVSDVLVKANTLANASVQQFSEALTNKAGAALKTVNKDIEEGVAVLAVFADQGVKGAEAGEALTQSLRDIQKAARKNGEEFADLGITVFDAGGNMRNMADIIADLEKATGGMSDATLGATLAQLGFQDRTVKNIQMLRGNSDAIREYEESLRDAAGITDEVANKQLQTFNAQMSLLKSAIDDVVIELGTKMLPKATEFVTWIRTDGIPKVERFAAAFNETVGPAMRDIGIVMRQDLIPAFKNVASASEGAYKALERWKILAATFRAIMVAIRGQISFTSTGFAGLAMLLNTDYSNAWRGWLNTGIDVVDNMVRASLLGFDAIASGYNNTLGRIPGFGNVSMPSDVIGNALNLDRFKLDMANSSGIDGSAQSAADRWVSKFADGLADDIAPALTAGRWADKLGEAIGGSIATPGLFDFEEAAGGGGGGIATEEIEEELEEITDLFAAFRLGLHEQLRDLKDVSAFGEAGAELMSQFREAIAQDEPELFQQLGNTAMSFVAAFAENVTPSQAKLIGDEFFAALNTAVSTGGEEGVDKLRDVLSAMNAMLAEKVEEALVPIEHFRGAFRAEMEAIVNEDVMGRTGAQVFESLTAAIADGEPKTLGRLAGFTAQFRDEMAEGLSPAVNAALATDLMAAIEHALEDGGADAIAAVADVMESINEEIAEGAAEAVMTARNFRDALASELAGVARIETFGNVGAGILEALEGALADPTEKTFARLAEATRGMIESIKGAIGKHSAKRFGKDLEEAIAAALSGEGSFGAVEKLLRRIDREMEMAEIRASDASDRISDSAKTASDSLSGLTRKGVLTDKELSINTLNVSQMLAQGNMFSQAPTIAAMTVGVMGAPGPSKVAVFGNAPGTAPAPSTSGETVNIFNISGFVGTPDDLIELIERRQDRSL